ncbi:hypothetical protein J1N35_010121 [Gossypium stocksii]|uniref:Uncharacterized protein n=1 Tax=Gossypium stocksii TaxID=47602 RepID=A0A9D3W1R2_9ROSI|nr:hypothetical protein J1N35_010121 [Gossypium stocksii]
MQVWSGKAVSDEVKWLSQGSNRLVKRYSAIIINGFRFHTKYRERLRRTQNCGIVVNSSIMSYASARDSNPGEEMWSITDFLPTLLNWITMENGKLSYFEVIGLM